ncbi:MAG: hypothetical protein ACTS27_04645 [Phycisphaerales bacterium]
MKRLLGASLLSACAALGACGYSYAPVTVVVKERLTEERVEGARVFVDYARTINPAPPRTAEGVTDADGRVTLDAAIYNRLVVYVTPPDGFEHVFAADHPAAYGSSGWINTYTDRKGNPAKVVIRVLPSGE